MDVCLILGKNDPIFQIGCSRTQCTFSCSRSLVPNLGFLSSCCKLRVQAPWQPREPRVSPVVFVVVPWDLFVSLLLVMETCQFFSVCVKWSNKAFCRSAQYRRHPLSPDQGGSALQHPGLPPPRAPLPPPLPWMTSRSWSMSLLTTTLMMMWTPVSERTTCCKSFLKWLTAERTQSAVGPVSLWAVGLSSMVDVGLFRCISFLK